jgi:hypothetical protein
VVCQDKNDGCRASALLRLYRIVDLYTTDIVKPEERKKGFGLKTWLEALKLISNQPAALDAVLQQVNNYSLSMRQNVIVLIGKNQ